MEQKSSRYPYVVEPFTEDYCGNLSWSRLGNLILRCASMHAGEHGFGYTQMQAVHHAWVLSRLVIEMQQPLLTGQQFSIETWVDRIYRQFTDRHFTLRLEDGSVCGHATSTWSLIDTASRQPADLTRLADGGFTHVLIADRPAPIAPLGRIRLKHPQQVDTHRAAYTDLDINGHVNSIRYIDLLLNQFNPEQLRENPVRRIEMAYCLEAYWGDTLSVFRDDDPNDPARSLYEIKKDGDEVVVRGSLQLSRQPSAE